VKSTISSIEEFKGIKENRNSNSDSNSDDIGSYLSDGRRVYGCGCRCGCMYCNRTPEMVKAIAYLSLICASFFVATKVFKK